MDLDVWVVNSRDQQDFKNGHLAGSINIMDGTKFETWLGSMIDPSEQFYIAVRDLETLKKLIKRTASIGYEAKIKEAFVLNREQQTIQPLDLEDFRDPREKYTIVDVRNSSEVPENPIFSSSISIPVG